MADFDLHVGMRLELAPASELVADPEWVEITALTPDEITLVYYEDNGMIETHDMATWKRLFEPRVLDAVMGQPGDTEPANLFADEPLTDPEKEEEEDGREGPETVPGEEGCAPPADEGWREPDEGVLAGEPEAKADPQIARVLVGETSPLVSVAFLLGQYAARKEYLEVQIAQAHLEIDQTEEHINDILKALAKQTILGNMPTAAEEAPDATAVKPPVPEEEEIPFGKPEKVAIAEKVADSAMQRALADEIENREGMDNYEKFVAAEMAKPMEDVTRITPNQAARLAQAGMKTLGEFTQRLNEHEDGRPGFWFTGIPFITETKAKTVEDAVATHWELFRRKHGRE